MGDSRVPESRSGDVVQATPTDVAVERSAILESKHRSLDGRRRNRFAQDHIVS